MSFLTMYTELKGTVPNISATFCKTLINRGWQDVRRQNLWSFQVYDSNWITPALLNTGLATAVQGSPTITLNATAAAALIAALAINGTYNPIIQRQFRIGISTVYNIIAFDGVVTLTLDRGYQEASVAGAAYQIYQVYYPAPFQDHLLFVSVRDMVNFTDLITTKSRIWLDEQDPQRTWYYFPTHVVFYRNGTDTANALTYKFPIFELWGVPLSNRSYQLYGIRRGVDLVANTDTLPACITEEVVIEAAKIRTYEWAEANKGALPRNQGPDFKFLMGEAKLRYGQLFKKLRQQDRETVDNWFSIRRSSLYGKYWASYNTISGTAYPGAYMG
ncbi:MAG: hypothetical protein ACREJN_11500 [Nitrospiraceae bacterium]